MRGCARPWVLALEQSERDYEAERRRRRSETNGGGASASSASSSLSMEEDVASRIVHGVPFTVMKSTFQAHLIAGLTSVEQVDVMMGVLRLNGESVPPPPHTLATLAHVTLRLHSLVESMIVASRRVEAAQTATCTSSGASCIWKGVKRRELKQKNCNHVVL